MKNAKLTKLKITAFIFIIIAYFFTLRSGSLKLPFLHQSITSLSDEVWRRVFPQQYLKFKGFNDRYYYYSYHTRYKFTKRELFSGHWGARLNTPHLGEPLEVPAMLRKRPDIKSVSLSPKISEDIYLKAKINEGIYPVRVVPYDKSKFRLVSYSEVNIIKSCEVLDKCREVILVCCN